MTFDVPSTEQASTVTVTSDVSAAIPVRLLAGVTLADATSAIDLAFGTFLATRESRCGHHCRRAPRRDPRRHPIRAVRGETMVTVESQGAFVQLTDGVGSYVPALNEKVRKGTLDFQPREEGLSHGDAPRGDGRTPSPALPGG